MARKPLTLTVDFDISALQKGTRDGSGFLADFGKSAQEMVADIRNAAGEVAETLSPAKVGQQMQQNVKQMFSDMYRQAEAAVAQGKDFDPLGGMSSAGMLKAAEGYEKAARAARDFADGAAAANVVGNQEVAVTKQTAAAQEKLAQNLQRRADAMFAQASAFAAMEAAMGRDVAQEEATARAAAEYAQLEVAAERLRNQLDPLREAQQRFDQELDLANRLLAAGVIGQETYARAVEMAQSKLDSRRSALQPVAAAAPAGPTAQELAQLEAAAVSLRGQLDPMYLAQRRFDQELTLAEAQLAQGIIREEEYRGAVALATQELQRHHAAIFNTAQGSQELVSAHNRMSVSSQMMMHSVRSATDSFAAGLPITMIFAEQISRLAEASAYYASESGKTEGAAARFANLMSGNWGLAIVMGISVISTLITHMGEFGDKVDEQVKKLNEQAQNEDTAREAQERYAQTLPGVVSAERKLTEELTRQISARKELIELTLANARQKEVDANAILADKQRELKAAQDARDKITTRSGAGEAAYATRESATQSADLKVAEAKKAVADAQTAVLDARTNVTRAEIVSLQARARAQADPKEAARQNIAARKDELTHRREAWLINDQEFIDGYAALQREEDATNKKKGPSAETLAHRAEAQRVKALNEDNAFTDRERQARHKLLDAMEKAAGGQDKSAERDALAREDAKAEYGASIHTIANDLSAKKIDGAQAERLKLLAKQLEDQKLANIDLERSRQTDAATLDSRQASLQLQNKLLELQGQLAPTLQERVDSARQILANDHELKVLGIKKQVSAGTISKQEGDQRIADEDVVYDKQVKVFDRENAGPMGTYRNQLQKNVGDMNTALQNVQVDGLKGLEDGLTGIISGTESVSSAFKKMAASILADLARIAVEKMIVSVIGGGLADGGKVAGISIGGRRDGGLLGYARGGIPGFAGGTRLASGMISGPGTGTSDSVLALVDGKRPIRVSNGEGIVNEQAVKNYWPLIDAMNHGTFPKFATGGLLSGAMASLAYPSIPNAQSLRAPGQTVVQHFTVDAKGAVLANELMSQMTQISQQHASAALAAAPALAQQRISAKADRRIT